MSQDLHHAGKNSYYFIIIDMPEYYSFPCFGLTNLTNAKIKHYVSLMQQKNILFRQHAIQNSSKLGVFNTSSLRMIIHPPLYLGLTSKLNERKERVKFTIAR